MAIALPFDLLASFPGWTTDFDLVYRGEESRQANGVTRVKDFGSPIWGGSWQSRSLSANELDEWRARLKVLEGGLKQFTAWPSSRCFPIRDAKGIVVNRVGQPSLLLDFVNDYAHAGQGYPASAAALRSMGKTLLDAGSEAAFPMHTRCQKLL